MYVSILTVAVIASFVFFIVYVINKCELSIKTVKINSINKALSELQKHALFIKIGLL